MRKAFILLLILFLSNLPSLYYGWYLDMPWVDVVQHFIGGFLVAMFMTAYLGENISGRSFLKNMLIVVGATTFVGVIWEFSEFIANQTLIEPFYRWFEIRAYFMGDLKDTMSDLLMDILGSSSFWIIHSLRSRKAH